MEKNILEQYESAKKEIRDLSNRIAELKQMLDKINDRKNINSTVKGGEGGEKVFYVNGYSKETAEDLEYLIRKDMRLLKARKEKANEIVIDVDKFINELNDSRMRRMLSLKYIYGKTWYQVAQAMGERYSPDSCKKQVQRFLKE